MPDNGAAANPMRVAREAFLNGLPTDEQIRVLRQAEAVGPLPDDADWLVAYAAQVAAKQYEATTRQFRSDLAALQAKLATQATPAKPQLASVTALGKRGAEVRWPAKVAAAAAVLMVLAAVSFAGAVGQRALDAARCRALGTFALPHGVHLPWLANALAAVARWSSVPLAASLGVALAVIVVLGVRKSGPPNLQVWP